MAATPTSRSACKWEMRCNFRCGVRRWWLSVSLAPEQGWNRVRAGLTAPDTAGTQGAIAR